MKAAKWVCWYYHTLSLPSHWSLTQQLLLTPVIILQSPAVSEFMYCACIIFLNGYKTVKNRRNSLWFALFYFWRYCASSKLMSLLLFTRHLLLRSVSGFFSHWLWNRFCDQWGERMRQPQEEEKQLLVLGDTYKASCM